MTDRLALVLKITVCGAALIFLLTQGGWLANLFEDGLFSDTTVVEQIQLITPALDVSSASEGIPFVPDQSEIGPYLIVAIGKFLVITLTLIIGLALPVIIPVALAWGIAKAYMVIHRQDDSHRSTKALRKKHEGDRAKWAELQAEAKRLGDRLMAYRRDLESILTMPLIVDERDPLTAEAIRAMGSCRLMAEDECPTLDMHQQVGATDFANGVIAFGRALSRAEENARRKGLSHLPCEDKRSMRRAHQLWRLATDAAASEHERAMAWDQIRSVDKIVPLPKEALLAIGEGQRLALTTGVQAPSGGERAG